jgi:hypothetical protein
MRRTRWHATATQWAFGFGILASTLVASASWLEGTLATERLIQVGRVTFAQRPYVQNVSTILDFAVFDPLAIWFIVKAKNGFGLSYVHFQKSATLPPYHRAGIALIAAVLSVSAMWFYYKGFVGGTVFTEAFAPGPNGKAEVSTVGWLIFGVTATFLYLIATSVAEYGNYLLFVRRIGPSDIRFSLPPFVSADVEIAIGPCVYVAYALAVLFVVLALFVIRDFWQLGLHRSRRVWLFAPYLAISLVTFLPFWHLHRVMSEQKRELIDANNGVIERAIKIDTRRHGEPVDARALIDSVDRIERLQVFYKMIPVWPSNSRTLFIPNLSLAVSGVTLVLKIIDSMGIKAP